MTQFLSANHPLGILCSHPVGWIRKGAFFFLLYSAVLTTVSSSASDRIRIGTREDTVIQRASENMNRRRRLRSGTECTLYMRATDYISNSEAAASEDKEQTWMCEISLDGSQEDTELSRRVEANHNEDLTMLRSSSTSMLRKDSSLPEYKRVASQPTQKENSATTSSPMVLVEIEGLDDDFFAVHGVKSGSTTMKISEGYLEEEGDEDDEPRDANSPRNMFSRMSSGSEQSTKKINTRIRPTVLTRMVVSPESVVEVVDRSSKDEQVDEKPLVRVHSGNFFDRGSFTQQHEQQQQQQQSRSKNSGRGRKPKQKSKGIGEFTTLVIRVIAENGIEPTNDMTTTQNNAFYDKVCLKSQYAACSKNQLIIKPFEGKTTTGETIEKGVVNVQVDINPTSKGGKGNGNREKLASRASQMAEKKLGNLKKQFDLVLFCLPPGTGDNWEAFANVNRWDSYYNDQWCGHVSSQLHEVGHNLNLAHSGAGNNKFKKNDYDDASGMMGKSYPNDDAPKMCFNGAKNFQLGWYERQQKSIDPTSGSPEIMTKISKTRHFVMNGIVDYEVAGDTKDKLVSLRLTQKGSEHDYYIGYNRATGFNEGTLDDENQIVVWEKPKGGPSGFGESWKLTSLQYRDQLYVIRDFGPKKHFVEIKLLSAPSDWESREDQEDVSISVTSYNAADSCVHSKEFQVPFKVNGETDDYAYETSWSLKVDSEAGGYMDFGSGYLQNTDFESTTNLCPGVCYVFQLNDIYGDGIKGGFIKGKLGEKIIFNESAFENETQYTKRFCVKDIDNIGDGSCKDNATLKYKNNKKKDCSWVGKLKNYRCKKTWKDKPLSEFCPKACKKC